MSNGKRGRLRAWLVSWLGGTGFESQLGWPFMSYHLILVCVNNYLNGSLRINSRLHARLNNHLSHPIPFQNFSDISVRHFPAAPKSGEAEESVKMQMDQWEESKKDGRTQPTPQKSFYLFPWKSRRSVLVTHLGNKWHITWFQLKGPIFRKIKMHSPGWLPLEVSKYD